MKAFLNWLRGWRHWKLHRNDELWTFIEIHDPGVNEIFFDSSHAVLCRRCSFGYTAHRAWVKSLSGGSIAVARAKAMRCTQFS